MTTSETSLLDTNVLVYAADRNSPFHQNAVALREKGLKGKISLCVCPQVLNEFFAIVTDPRRSGNPRSQKEAMVEMEKYLHSKSILKIYSGSSIIEKTLELLKRYEMSPISQAPSDKLIVSDEQPKNTKRLVEKIERPVMNPSIPPPNPMNAQIHAQQYARLPTDPRARNAPGGSPINLIKARCQG